MERMERWRASRRGSKADSGVCMGQLVLRVSAHTTEGQHRKCEKYFARRSFQAMFSISRKVSSKQALHDLWHRIPETFMSTHDEVFRALLSLEGFSIAPSTVGPRIPHSIVLQPYRLRPP